MASAAVMEPPGHNATLSSPQRERKNSSESLLKEEEAPVICNATSIPAGSGPLSRADPGKSLETRPATLCDATSNNGNHQNWKGLTEEARNVSDLPIPATEVIGEAASSSLRLQEKVDREGIICNDKMSATVQIITPSSRSAVTNRGITSAESDETGIHENGSLSDGIQTQPSCASSLPDSKVAAEDSGTGSSLESSDKDRSESMHTEPSDDIDEENQLEVDSTENDFLLQLEEESSSEQNLQMSVDPPADEDVEAANGTPTARNPGSMSPSPSCGKSNPRVPRYPSIIRTRKRVEQEGMEESTEHISSGKRSRHSSGDQPATPAKVMHAEDATKMDDTNGDRRALSVRGGKRPGRGRGRGGIKRHRSIECPVSAQPPQKIKSPSNTSPPMSAPASKRGRTRASPAKPGRSPIRTMTRATTAEMKKVQFLSLPGRKRRRKDQQGDEEEDEAEEEMEVPLTKKDKNDEDMEDVVEEGVVDKEGEHVDDKEGDEEKDLCEEKEDKDQILDSLPSRGRGGYRRGTKRGKRGRGGKGAAPPTSSEVKQDSSEQPEEEQAPETETNSMGKEGKVEPEDSQQQGESKGKEEVKTKVKKRRGRPPRRPKDDSTSNITSSTTVAEDDMDVALKARPVTVSEPLKNPDQIVELLQLSETMEGGRVSPPNKKGSSTPDKIASKKPSDKTAPTEVPADPESSRADEVSENKTTAIKTEKNKAVKSPAEVEQQATPTKVEEQATPAIEPLPDDGDKKDSSSVAPPSPLPVSTATTAAAVMTGLEQPMTKGQVPQGQEEQNDGSMQQSQQQQSQGESVKSPVVDMDVVAQASTPTAVPLAAGSQQMATAPATTGFPFPQYEQGYPPHHLHPMHFIPPTYPPFTAPPYPYMVPASPSFAPYPQEHCIPPHNIYQGFHEEIQQYPRFTQPTPCSSSPSPAIEVTAGTFVPAHSQEPMATSAPSPIPNVATPTCSHPCTPMPPHSMEMPHPLSQPYGPHPSHIPGYPMPPPHPYNPHTMLPMVTDWPAPHGPPTQRTPPIVPTPTIRPATKPEPRFPLNFYQDDNQSSHPVDCPECGRQFKNNKALNGHMRLHGGFDWTRKAIQQLKQQQPMSEQQQEASSRQEEAKQKASKDLGHSSTVTPSCKQSEQKTKGQVSLTHKALEGKEGSANHKGGKVEHPPSTPRKHKGKSKAEGLAATSPARESHFAGTLDDLCRAAEELERIEKNSVDLHHTSLSQDKPRPTPLILPHERRFNNSPPYTPPPILSPARSISLLTGPITPSTAGITTPNKIMWRPRTSGENIQASESEESFTYSEPKINVGPEFQAELPICDESRASLSKVSDPAYLSWKPLVGLTQEEEDTVDGYLELACSPAIPHGGRNKELALHVLNQTNGSIKDAVRLLVMGKTLTTKGSPLNNFNYSGSKKWSARDRQQFRRAWRVHRKQFHLICSAIENKSLAEIVEFYYSWKKYCPDEYRGRNRHASEEILSEEDDHYPRPASATSSSSHSSASNDLDHSTGTNNNAIIANTLATSSSTSGTARSTGSSNSRSAGSTSYALPAEMIEHLPKSLLHQSGQLNFSAGHIPVQEYRCKYPGCNQVYTSIFALNGHIRIHGGSWYPKKPDVESNGGQDSSVRSHLSTSTSVSGTSSSAIFSKARREREEGELRHQLEIAKTMVIDLAQPRSPAHVFAGLAPTSRPSPPNRSKSSLVRSKKACSSSPNDRDGHYPCNRCGRVFSKVKSRSAHMKSHIMKQQ